MTAEMLAKSRHTAAQLALDHVELRDGLAEALPAEDGWAGRPRPGGRGRQVG